MKNNTILGALGLESVDDVVASAVPEVEPTELVEVVPGAAEEIEIELKDDDSAIAESVDTAETFGEVAEGLEAIRDRLISLRGTQVSVEAMAFAGEAIRSSLRRIKLTPRNVAGLESFIEVAAIGVAPANDGEVKSEVVEAEVTDVTGEADVTKAEADAAKDPVVEGADVVVDDKEGKTETVAAVGTEDDSDIGGAGATADVTDEDKKVDAVAETADGTTDAAAADAATEVDAAAAEADAAAAVVDADAAATTVTVDTAESDKPRVEITITDDELNVAIEGLDNFIGRLHYGQEGLLDQVAKSAGDAVTKAFYGYDTVKERANNVVVASKGLTGEPKAAEISTTSAQKLHVGGKVDVKSIIAGVKNIPVVSAYLTDTYAKRVAETIAKGAATEDDEAYKATVTAAFKPYTSVEFSGGKVLSITSVDGSILSAVAAKDPKVKVDTKATFATPTPAEVKELSKAIYDATKVLQDRKERVIAANKVITEAFDKVEQDAGAKKKSTIAKILARYYLEVVRNFNVEAFSSLRSAVQVAEQAIKQYESK